MAFATKYYTQFKDSYNKTIRVNIQTDGYLGSNDWYLPSRDELAAMYDNLHLNGLGNFVTDLHWSSSEVNATTSHSIDFTDRGNYTELKGFAYRIRPSRTFTATAGLYSLGDSGPNQGWIYYISGTTYYEAAPADLTAAAWSNVTGTAVTGTGTAIGTGEANTALIIDQVGHTSSAALDTTNYINQIYLSSNSCFIKWNADPNNPYKAIRSSVATIGLFQTSYTQLDEFFDITQNEYRVQIQIDTVDYWYGFLIAGDYQKPYKYTGFIQIRATDNLGILSGVKYKNSGAIYTGRDTAFNIINKCVAKTGLSLGFYEMVNMYETGMTSTAASSPLKQVYIDQESFVDHFTHEALDCYDVIEKLLTPFNAVIFQEDGVWNIVRIPDLKFTSNYRDISSAGAVTASGSESLTKALSANNASDANYLRFLNNDAIIKASLPVASLDYYFPVKNNLLLDGSFENASLVSDYYTDTNGIADIITPIGEDTVLRLTFANNNHYIEYKTTYHAVNNHPGSATQGFRLTGRWKLQFNPAASVVDDVYEAWAPIIILDDGVNLWFKEQGDANWLDYGLVWPRTPRGEAKDGEWQDFEYILDGIKATSDYEIKIRFAVFSGDDGGGNDVVQYIFFDDVKIEFIGGLVEETETKVLDANNIYGETDDVIDMFFRDSDVADTQLMVKNAMSLASEVRAYQWQAGYSRSGTSYEISQDVYEAALRRPAIIYQGVLHGQFAYKNTIDDGEGRRCFSSNVRYDMVGSNWDGEWLEIKQGLGSELVTAWTNSAGIPFDTFTDNGDTTFDGTTTTTAAASSNTITVESDYYYKVVISIEDRSNAGIWGISWGTFSSADISDGDIFYVKPGSDTVINIDCDAILSGAVDSTVGISVKKYYGV